MKIAAFLALGLAVLALVLWHAFGRAQQVAPIQAGALQAHLEHYARAGHHRSGGDGDAATRDWLSGELRDAGFDVEVQSIPFEQWNHEEAYLETAGGRLEGFPLWWPPRDPGLRSVSGRVRLVADAGPGDIGVISIDPYLLASLKDEHRKVIADASERGLVGIIILTKTISGEHFAFNAEAGLADIAVLILGSEHAGAVDKVIADETAAQLRLHGDYQTSATWNVIGRLNRAGSETVVVSTPRTGWFNCGAERGPGVALFVELARWAASEGDADLVFVATGGHEIAHIGMDAFMKAGAPDPQTTANWVHLGASIAAHEWADPDERRLGASSAQNSATRWIIFSENQTFEMFRHFHSLGYQFSPANVSVFGEAKDVHAAGYSRFFAFAGGHPYFHLPSDEADNTSGEMLAPVALAIQKIMLKSL